MEILGPVWAHFKGFLGLFRPILELFGHILAHFLMILGLFWSFLAISWPILGLIGPILGQFRLILELFWSSGPVFLSLFEPILADFQCFGPILGLYGTCWAYFVAF